MYACCLFTFAFAPHLPLDNTVVSHRADIRSSSEASKSIRGITAKSMPPGTEGCPPCPRLSQPPISPHQNKERMALFKDDWPPCASPQPPTSMRRQYYRPRPSVTEYLAGDQYHAAGNGAIPNCRARGSKPRLSSRYAYA